MNNNLFFLKNMNDYNLITYRQQLFDGIKSANKSKSLWNGFSIFMYILGALAIILFLLFTLSTDIEAADLLVYGAIFLFFGFYFKSISNKSKNLVIQNNNLIYHVNMELNNRNVNL